MLSGEYFKNEDYAWGGLTLVFIYLPATHTMAALLGPKVAGKCSIEWGGVMATIGVIVLNVGFSVGSIGGSGIGLFIVLLGMGTVFLGCVLVNQQQTNEESISSAQSCGSSVLKHLLYPFLFIISPLIFLYIKFLRIIKSENKLIECQKKISSMGEAILEASPQYCLQMYIVLHTLDPSTS